MFRKVSIYRAFLRMHHVQFCLAMPCITMYSYEGGFCILDRRVNHEQRTTLFERVAATTEGRVEITLSLQLGFHKSLPSRELRQITTATGQSVPDIGRHV